VAVATLVRRTLDKGQRLLVAAAFAEVLATAETVVGILEFFSHLHLKQTLALLLAVAVVRHMRVRLEALVVARMVLLAAVATKQAEAAEHSPLAGLLFLKPDLLYKVALLVAMQIRAAAAVVVAVTLVAAVAQTRTQARLAAEDLDISILLLSHRPH